MAQLRHDHPSFVEREAEIIVIGPEGPRTFGRFWRINDMPFVGIPDPAHRIARAYRQEVNLLKLGRMPALLVVDKQGRIVYRHMSKSMSDIPSNKEVLAVLDSQVGDAV